MDIRAKMNRYYVEMEHPKGKEEYGTTYIYMYAYDKQQIIDMVDEKITHIEKIYEWNSKEKIYEQ